MNKDIHPTITISLKKPLIRIYKDTLHLIGNPSHVLLLVNPNEKTLVIYPSNKSDLRAHFVGKYMAKNNKSIELYSKPLINQLKLLCPIWQENQTYRIIGEYIKAEDIVKFNLPEAIIITK